MFKQGPHLYFSTLKLKNRIRVIRHNQFTFYYPKPYYLQTSLKIFTYQSKINLYIDYFLPLCLYLRISIKSGHFI